MKFSCLIVFLALLGVSTGAEEHDDIHWKSVSRAKGIARALKEHANEHEGRLPRFVKVLAPKYLKMAETWVPIENPQHSDGIQMLIARHPIDDLDVPPMSFIAFSSVPDKEGMRLVIDQTFQVWRCGEVAFQRCLAGEKADPKPVRR